MAKISRRGFVTRVAVTSAGFAIVPRHVLGRGFTAPSDTLNVAAVGVGGMGRSNLVNLASENIVAMCDVDWEYADKGFADLDKRDQDAAGATRSAAGPAEVRRAGPAGAAAHADRAAAHARSDRAHASPEERPPAAAPRGIRTTGRCSTSRRTSTPSSSPRRITCTRRSRWRRWISANTSTCRSR